MGWLEFFFELFFLHIILFYFLCVGLLPFVFHYIVV